MAATGHGSTLAFAGGGVLLRHVSSRLTFVTVPNLFDSRFEELLQIPDDPVIS